MISEIITILLITQMKKLGLRTFLNCLRWCRAWSLLVREQSSYSPLWSGHWKQKIEHLVLTQVLKFTFWKYFKKALEEEPLFLQSSLWHSRDSLAIINQQPSKGLSGLGGTWREESFRNPSALPISQWPLLGPDLRVTVESWKEVGEVPRREWRAHMGRKE